MLGTVIRCVIRITWSKLKSLKLIEYAHQAAQSVV